VEPGSVAPGADLPLVLAGDGSSLTASLAERAYHEIKRLIITGGLAPGAAILEGTLAARFGVSKTPIREALKRLELEGLTRVLPRVGYVVSPVSVGDVRALFELRMMLEPAAAELAADRVSPELLAELDSLARVSFAGADRENYAQLLEVNSRFHLDVVRGAGNARLTEILARALAEAERILHMAVDLRDASDLIIRDHVEIVRALREKDGARARRVSERHLEASRQRVLQAIVSGSGLTLLVDR
jgi:DNA-binding GntR family transcriptional regulator